MTRKLSETSLHQQQAYLSKKTYDPKQKLNLGQRKRFNNFKRRLSAFFRFTQEEGVYAANRNSKGKYVPSMITLTYPDNSHWKPDHITKFINTLRNHMKRKQQVKLRYAWVAETTKKGVIHYHIVFWHLRKQRVPKPSEAGWWKHGRSKIEGVRKGVYGYLLKYITKGTDLNGLGLYSQRKDGKKQAARMFGYGGLASKDREFLSHQMLPNYVKRIFGPTPWGTIIKRVKGGWEAGKTTVQSNFESYWDANNNTMVYEYGVAWCELPDKLEDGFTPF